MYSATTAETVMTSSNLVPRHYAGRDGEYELTFNFVVPGNANPIPSTSIMVRIFHDDCSPNLTQDSKGYSPPTIDYYVGYPAMTVEVPAFSSGTCKVLSRLESRSSSWQESKFTWIKADQTTASVAPYTNVFTQTSLLYTIKTDSTDDIGEYELRATLWRVGATDEYADAGEVLTGKDVPTFKVRI